MSRPISAKVRAEAIEYAGCMAMWWQNDTGATMAWDVEALFSEKSILLAVAARDLIESTNDFCDHWYDVEGIDGSHSYSGASWAEVQAMLIEGWSP